MMMYGQSSYFWGTSESTEHTSAFCPVRTQNSIAASQKASMDKICLGLLKETKAQKSEVNNPIQVFRNLGPCCQLLGVPHTAGPPPGGSGAAPRRQRAQPRRLGPPQTAAGPGVPAEASVGTCDWHPKVIKHDELLSPKSMMTRFRRVLATISRALSRVFVKERENSGRKVRFVKVLTYSSPRCQTCPSELREMHGF